MRNPLPRALRTSATPVLPEDGPRNPVFAALDREDTVHATLLFAAPLSEAELDAAERAVLLWFAVAEWGGRSPVLAHETLTRSCLHVAVTDVTAAQAALGELLTALGDADLRLRRAMFARVRADGDRNALVQSLDAAARAEVRYEDREAWWRACFDVSLAPPVSEDRAELACDDDAILEAEQTTFVERRAMPLHVSELRICYGLAPAEFVDESPEDTERAQAAARALDHALDARFLAGDEPRETPAARPVPYDRLRRYGAALDRIRVGDRTGYSCAIHSNDLREFLHDHLFRFREHELMLAVRDAVSALELEPVVCWRRFAGRYVLQLWDRSASRVHVAA